MPRKAIYRIYSYSLLSTMILLIIFAGLNSWLDGTFWEGMKISKSALTVEYCEWNNPAAFFHQRMNTYSNLGYFFLGSIAFFTGIYDLKNNSEGKLLCRFPALSIFFGICLMYLCLASSFFHASLTWTGQRADMNGTYSIAIALLAISLYRANGNELSKGLRKIIIAALVILVVIFIEIHLRVSSFVLLPALIVIIIILSMINYRKSSGFRIQLALLSLLFLVAAAVLRVLDVQKIGCDPLSFYQGHALWHFFTGMSAFLLYWFYRTEA